MLNNTAYASDDQAPDVMDAVTTTVVAAVVVPVAPVVPIASEVEITVPIPDTNAASPIVFYGMGALMAYAGYKIINRKKDLS